MWEKIGSGRGSIYENQSRLKNRYFGDAVAAPGLQPVS
jgi:hypothetical protein